MLGRPKSGTPVHIASWPGWWLNDSVCIDRTRAMSSAQIARCGRKSDKSIPHCPCFRNLRGLPRRRALLLDEGEAHVLRHRVGQLLPIQFVQLGLGIEKVNLTRRTFEIDADQFFACGGSATPSA